MPSTDVLIIGGGLAGLAAAHALHRAGVPSILLEASDAVGGRVRTDTLDGFILDRGFQVYLKGYPEGRRILDYAALDLKPFEPGAMVRHAGKFHTLLDPWRRPTSIIDGALAAVGSIPDKIRVGLMRAQLQAEKTDIIYDRPETSILAALQHRGFSQTMIDRFWRPFLGGITLDTSLSASSRMMEFVFRCFSLADAAVPARGMQRIPEQIAARLPKDTILLNTRVTALSPGRVTTTAGEFTAPRIILATDAADAHALLPRKQPRAWRSVVNLCFAINGPAPVTSPILILDGDQSGLATNVAFMSSISPAYAPPGKALASVSVIGARPESDADLGAMVLRQMGQWFGYESVESWNLLRVYRIARALPDQTPPWLTRSTWNTRIAEGLYAAGDSHDTASIDGALTSGRRAAEAVLEDLSA